MKTFSFFLGKPWGKPNLTKRVAINAPDLVQARQQICEKYKGWEVQMFWEDYPQKKEVDFLGNSARVLP